MENINQHIVELVLRYQCVIIPKLGCFTKTSQFSHTSNTTISKSETLCFEQNSKLDDGMLYKYVSVHENISISEAKLLVDSFTAQLKIAVFNKKQYDFAPLGSFVLSNEDTISFNYNTKFSIHPELYGTSSFIGQPILRETTPVDLVKEKRNRKYYWAAACLAPLLGISIYFGLNKQDLNENYVGNSAGLSEISIQNTVSKLNLSDLEELNFDYETEEEEELVFYNLKPKTTIKSLKKKGYQIIVGVFGEKQNAEKLVKSLNQGLKIENYKGMFKVSSELYLSKSDARKDLNIVRNTNPKAWLLKIK